MKAIKLLGCQFYPTLDNYEVHVRFTVRLKLAVSEPKVLFATQIYCAASSGSTWLISKVDWTAMLPPTVTCSS